MASEAEITELIMIILIMVLKKLDSEFFKVIDDIFFFFFYLKTNHFIQTKQPERAGLHLSWLLMTY